VCAMSSSERGPRRPPAAASGPPQIVCAGLFRFARPSFPTNLGREIFPDHKLYPEAIILENSVAVAFLLNE
jgi:hypothetical protein